MKQILINTKEGKVQLENVPAPLCKDDGVLIQVRYSLISTGTELASFKTSESYLHKAVRDKDFRKKAVDFVKSQGIKKSLDMIKDKDKFSPTGYCGAGIVIEVGQNVIDIKIGDRVAYGGVSHAEIVCAPRNFVVKLPDNVEFEDGTFTALGSIAIQAIRRAKVELGETILVVGLGLLGQLVNQLLQVAGCHVVGSDLSEKRIVLARNFGLEKGINVSKEDLGKEVMNYLDQTGVDAAIICAQSKSSDIINQTMELCRERGRVVIVGDVGLQLERRPFFINELDLMISRAYGPGSYDEDYKNKRFDYPIGYVKWTANRNMEEFLILLSQGKISVKKLISKKFKLKAAQSAYEELQEGKDELIGVLLEYEPKEAMKSVSEIIITSKRKIEKGKGDINVAVIGAGGISKGYHLPNLKKINGAYIHAIVSGGGVNARQVAKKYRAAYCSQDYKEVLKDKDIDCVLIATHHNLHKEMIIESAKAGKHIYVEKPMAMNYEDVREIVKTIKHTGIIMTVGTNRRYSPLSIMTKEIIKKKGRPVLINYRINTTALPLGHWVNDPIEGGGRIIGETPHFFDLMYWLLDAEPTKIYAECVSSNKKNLISENNIVSTINFADGSIASLSYCDFGSSDFPREKIEVFTGGTVIEINDFKEIRTSDGIHKKYNFLNIGLYESLANFIKVLQRKRKLELGVEDGARSTICALKVLESLKLREPVYIDSTQYLSNPLVIKRG